MPSEIDRPLSGPPGDPTDHDRDPGRTGWRSAKIAREPDDGAELFDDVIEQGYKMVEGDGPSVKNASANKVHRRALEDLDRRGWVR